MKGTEVVAVRRVLHTEKYFVTADERVIRPYGILFKKISILCLILSWPVGIKCQTQSLSLSSSL